MAKVTTKTEAKSEVKERRVFLTLTGRSVSYNTPQAFIDEALKLGVSRKVVGASVHPGDVILFGVAPFRLKREEGFTFKPLLFGYSVVKGYAIHPRTEIARKVLSATITKLMERGLAEVTDHLDEFVTRRCGYYRISRRVVVHDWDEFVETFHDLWSRELRSHTDVTARKTLTHFDFLVQGDFKVIEPPIELPFEIKYTRTLRLIKPDELTLLQNALKERLDTAAVEAFLGERPDQPAVLLELSEYVQQAQQTQPRKATDRRQRRRKVKEQPTHIPEPEPEAPKPETPEPLINLQPEPQQKPQSHCIHCGKPITGGILCQECKQTVLNKIKELRGVGASQ
jgi:hypothetical protein